MVADCGRIWAPARTCASEAHALQWQRLLDVTLLEGRSCQRHTGPAKRFERFLTLPCATILAVPARASGDTHPNSQLRKCATILKKCTAILTLPARASGVVGKSVSCLEALASTNASKLETSFSYNPAPGDTHSNDQLRPTKRGGPSRGRPIVVAQTALP